MHNEVDIVKLLLDHNADMGALERQGRMPLHYATMHFIPLENGATVRNTSEVDIVKILVYNGADVNARDKHKHTPLHYASKKASADVIKSLSLQALTLVPVTMKRRLRCTKWQSTTPVLKR